MLNTLLFLVINTAVTGTFYSDTLAPATNKTVIISLNKTDTSLLNIDDFEGYQPANFWHSELLTPAAGLLVGERYRAGKQAIRFSWRPDQNDGTNTTLHAELATSPLTNGDNERWYGYSVYLPASSMSTDDETIIITQWHGFPDEGGAHTVPAVAISIEPGNTLQLVYRASTKPIITFRQHPTSQKIMTLGTVDFDQWIDYVVHVKWDPIGTDGLLQLWQNGKLILNEQKISIGYQEQRKPYWKIGLYAWTGKSIYSEKIIYYDEIRIGDSSATYENVRPGIADKTTR